MMSFDSPNVENSSPRTLGSPSSDSDQPHYITLTQIAKIAPGRPKTNCVWRWCRKGVMSRSGERVRLKHVRIGGMIYSTRHWLDEFGRRLAEADERYFDLVDAAQRGDAARRRRKETRTEEARRMAIEDAERELRAAGI